MSSNAAPVVEPTMSFLEHLDELRRRLTYSAIAIAITFTVCFVYSEQIYHFLDAPVREALKKQREIQLSDQQFRALWPGTRGRRLRKVRYEIPWNDVLIEIDVYGGKNNGLIVAEVEFPNRTACRKFKPPGWLGREVTGEKRYSNIQLGCE